MTASVMNPLNVSAMTTLTPMTPMITESVTASVPHDVLVPSPGWPLPRLVMAITISNDSSVMISRGRWVNEPSSLNVSPLPGGPNQ